VTFLNDSKALALAGAACFWRFGCAAVFLLFTSHAQEQSPPPALGEGVDIQDLGPNLDVSAGADSASPAGTPAANTGRGIVGFYGNFKLKPAPILTDALFPADSIVKTRAHFWFHIFAMISESEGLVHDAERLEIVYGKVNAPGAYTRSGRAWVASALQATRSDLLALAAWRSTTGAGSSTEPSDPVLKSLAKTVPAYWDSAAIVASAERLRFQRGLRERFLAGLTRSYRWLPVIESTFVSRGLPKRLQYLPHVESSFMPSAYSKVGAAGMWQFMKSTGKRYGLKANYLLDERRDPAKSTEAAARLLADSHRLVGTWPLALTGYNHGPSGVRRAVNAVGSSDLDVIIRNYDGKRFGFASGNFFAEFLAASSAAILADSLFPGHPKHEPLATLTFALPKAVGVPVLLKQTGLSPLEMESFNLALRPAVFRGKATLPKGMNLHLPATLDSARLAALRQGLLPAALASDLEPGLVVAAENRAPVDKAAAPGVSEVSSGSALAAAAPGKAAQVMRRDDKPQARLSAASPVAVPAKGRPEAVLRPASEPLASALEIPAAISEPKASERMASPGDLLALSASVGDRVHPWDAFHSGVYGLEYARERGRLSFSSGPQETLSHYAEWSGLGMSAVRTANRLRGRRGLNLGRKVVLPLDSTQADAFIKRREENYRAIEEDFYGSYHVASLEPLPVTRGFSVWDLAMKKDLPFWLLQKHNAGRDLAALHPGDTVLVPVVENGLRRWGFTRYANGQEALASMALRLGDAP
jgi:membrane-bound lytic murein transglycosylase D